MMGFFITAVHCAWLYSDAPNTIQHHAVSIVVRGVSQHRPCRITTKGIIQCYTTQRIPSGQHWCAWCLSTRYRRTTTKNVIQSEGRC